MKKLVRTVPMPSGDDSLVHEDILSINTKIIVENDSQIENLLVDTAL